MVGRTSLAIAAFTDAALALAFVKALPDPEKFRDVAEKLDIKAQKLRQRTCAACNRYLPWNWPYRLCDDCHRRQGGEGRRARK